MAKHDPNEVALLKDIDGYCENCHRRTNARLVAYYSKEVIIRCNNCKVAGKFKPSDKTYNDPRKFLPFHDDNDDANQDR